MKDANRWIYLLLTYAIFREILEEFYFTQPFFGVPNIWDFGGWGVIGESISNAEWGYLYSTQFKTNN